jgi:hypothetical protein
MGEGEVEGRKNRKGKRKKEKGKSKKGNSPFLPSSHPPVDLYQRRPLIGSCAAADNAIED